MIAEQVGDVPQTLDDLVGDHAPQGPPAPPHAGSEAGEDGFQVLGDGGPHLRAQRLLVGDDPGAGQCGRRITGQAGEAGRAGRQAAHGQAGSRAVVRDMRHRVAGDAAEQEPRHGDQQAGRPGVAVEAEARDHIRAARLSVVPPYLCLVPAQELVEAAVGRREGGGGDPAVMPWELLAGRRLDDVEPREDLGETGVGVHEGRGRHGHGGPPIREALKVSLTLPEIGAV